MQTRKRAKSVSFGKKDNEKKEKEPVKESGMGKIVAAESEKAEEVVAEKADIKKETITPEIPISGELSATPPKIEDETESSPTDAATSTNEFLTDNSLASSPEVSKTATDESVNSADNKLAETVSTSPLSTEPPQETETPTQPVAAPDPEPQPTQPPSENQTSELSPTSPQSAFTIQSNGAAPTQMMQSGDKKRFGFYFFIVALLSFILGLVAIGAASYFGIIKLSIPQIPMLISKAAPTPKPTVLPTVVPTQKPIDLTAYTISVLNGGGVAGKAADVKSTLTTAGYKVSSVGNADNNNYTKTEISAKSTVDKTYLSKLQDDLNKSFVVDSTVGTLPASSTSDVTVTLGSQKAQ